jgi:hypothetical protein
MGINPNIDVTGMERRLAVYLLPGYTETTFLQTNNYQHYERVG